MLVEDSFLSPSLNIVDLLIMYSIIQADHAIKGSAFCHNIVMNVEDLTCLLHGKEQLTIYNLHKNK